MGSEDASCYQGPWEGPLGQQLSSESQFENLWSELNLFLGAGNKTCVSLKKSFDGTRGYFA